MSAYETVRKLVQEWQPAALPTELKYRNSLAIFLRERLKDTKIETEYRHSGTTTDIYVRQAGFLGSTEVFVELKRDLAQKTQFDRLIGQIECFSSRNPIIVVLCGETKSELVARLKEKYGLSADIIFRQMAVVVKQTSKTSVL
jgi:hypothetical protein